MSSELYEESKMVNRANLRFYRAFETLDFSMMRSVWSKANYIKCVHPGAEMLVGYEAVMASWRRIFEQTECIKFSVRDIDVRVIGNIAWVTLTECVETGFSEHERGTVVAANNLYEKTDGAWLMIMHHSSPMLRRVGAELGTDILPGLI